ncbi:MAG: hypothetical protein K2X07_08570 [Caulobacteraceae bacterium]|nr:hypothetical protein [Caulobacteraceae bacterium]
MRRSALFAAVGLTALLVAGAASAQSISVGQTVRGTISSSDAALDDGSNYDCWIFTAPAGVYTVDYSSEDFDAFVAVGKGRDCSAQTDTVNDDWGDGLNSHIEFRTDGGAWFIRANTLSADESGDYTLSLVSGGDPANMLADEGPEDASEDSFDMAWVDQLEGRPGGEEHLLNVLCAAVDTLDLIVTMEGMTDQQLEARMAEGFKFSELAYASGAALGFGEEDVEGQIAELGATLLMDPESTTDFSGARQECLAMLG